MGCVYVPIYTALSKYLNMVVIIIITTLLYYYDYYARKLSAVICLLVCVRVRIYLEAVFIFFFSINFNE